MREILFRGKQEYKNKEWAFGSLHSEYGETDKNGQRKIDYRILGMRGECDYVLSETVGQFTGLTDKNGKKIFEGDILKFGDCGIYPVWWDADFFTFGSCWFSDFDPLYKYDRNKIEVIGNIHDNPELIGGGESEIG